MEYFEIEGFQDNNINTYPDEFHKWTCPPSSVVSFSDINLASQQCRAWSDCMDVCLGITCPSPLWLLCEEAIKLAYITSVNLQSMETYLKSNPPSFKTRKVTVGPVVACSPADQEVRGSNPTLA